MRKRSEMRRITEYVREAYCEKPYVMYLCSKRLGNCWCTLMHTTFGLSVDIRLVTDEAGIARFEGHIVDFDVHGKSAKALKKLCISTNEFSAPDYVHNVEETTVIALADGERVTLESVKDYLDEVCAIIESSSKVRGTLPTVYAGEICDYVEHVICAYNGVRSNCHIEGTEGDMFKQIIFCFGANNDVVFTVTVRYDLDCVNKIESSVNIGADNECVYKSEFNLAGAIITLDSAKEYIKSECTAVYQEYIAK